MAYRDSMQKVDKYNRGYRSREYRAEQMRIENVKMSYKKLENQRSYDYKVPKLKGYNSKTRYVYDANGWHKQTIYTRRENPVSAGGLFKIVIFILLLVVLYGVLVEDVYLSNITFTGFLKVLEKAPVLKTSWISDFTLNLNFFGKLPVIIQTVFKDIFDFFMLPIRFLCFFGTGVAQIMVYIGYFVGILFAAPPVLG